MVKPKRKRKPQLHEAPEEKALAAALPCGACHVELPPHAKFCFACGEPQRAGLQRPVYGALSAEAAAAPRPATPVTVPSVPRVTPRAASPVLVPSLSLDRPIPASLLQSGVSAENASAPVAAAEPTLAQSPAAAPASPPAAADQPLFDAATEARILGLRTAHELTLERFERLMVGFRLKPKPKPRAVPANTKEKSKEKAEKKPKDKASKGH